MLGYIQSERKKIFPKKRSFKELGYIQGERKKTFSKNRSFKELGYIPGERRKCHDGKTATDKQKGDKA